MSAMQYPGVGTGVYIRKDGKILLGLRSGKTAPGTWCAPGGKLDMFESWEACAARETREEAGIEVANLALAAVTDDPSPEIGTHFITLQFVCDWVSGEARVCEPDKFARWEWFEWDKLPEPLFWPTRNFIQKGYNPFTF